MDASQLRESLVQVLENYRRCGVTHFTRARADEVPAELLTAVGQFADAAAEVATAASSGVPRQSEPAGESASAVPNSRLTGAVAPSPESSPPLSGSEWTLPVLNDQDRQTRFAELNGQVKACRKCLDIVDFRRQTVFGVGSMRPAVCFMGEAPGADEDRLGEPFVGRAGQLLTKIIAAMKMRREDVYILNALKCRPPQNRTPVPEEIENCRHFVEAQLDILQPKYIVCLGAVSVRSILQSNLSIGRLRGRFHQYRGARVVVTYHPSYLLRNEDAKRLVWEDMQMLMRELGTL